jgi:DedD protein
LNVPNQIHDDGFHEIQLNGKQLVFLFMAATVVSVVIFLCGVLVGRGVRAERAAESAVAANAEPTPAPPPTPAQPPAGSDPTTAPPPTSEDLTYFNRLEKPTPAQEQLKPPAADHKAAAPEHKPREAAATIGKSPAPRAVERPAREPERSAPKETAPASNDASKAAAAEPPPAGDGFAVQIAALNVRSEADAIAKRLSSKGYTAYVMSPANGTPSVYRVRIGKFPTRREAESIAAKLQKEEQFKPWVTR